MPLDSVRTIQLQAFANSVYEEVVEIEESVLQGNEEVPGICGLRVFARLDIALIWDNRDADKSKHRYRFVINEVPGDASLFMMDEDCWTSILRGFVEGIEQGSWEG